MNMPDGDIITSYKQAKDHKAQISILADLNSCDRYEMEQYLVRLGCIHGTPPPSFDYLRAAALYAEGKSDLDIAEELGVEKTKVGTWRRSKCLTANRTSQRAPRCAAAKAPPKTKAVQRPAPAKATPTVLTVGRLAELLRKLATDTPEAVVLAGGAAITNVTMISDFGPDGTAQRAEVQLMTREAAHGA